MACIFCNRVDLEILVENELAFAIFDKYPVNEGHMLMIPKRHFQNYFDATDQEIIALHQLIQQCKGILEEKYQPHGYNIGINVNEVAGQTIMHLHIHLIPRYRGDVERPRGGIRNIKTPLVPY